jgi:hypothetical protein
MGNSKTWSSPGINFKAFTLYNIYIEGLPPTINTLSGSILFTDDTHVIFSSKNFDDFSTVSNTVLSCMSKWFKSKKLVLNLDKSNIITFIKSKSPQYDLKIGYYVKYVEESINTKFLGLQTNNHLNWKNHIALMIPKLSRACYAVTLMSHISGTDTLKSVYFAYFHSIMKYGIIFLG